ncbi:MAG: hypothetical protein AABX11_05560 [Nanoarchaeota archaeon]
MQYLFTPKELEVIKSMKVPGFGAYLQGVWFDKSDMDRSLQEGKLPSKESLIEITEKMEDRYFKFDHKYNFTLPRQPVNPLKQEQVLWERLSPRIEVFVKGASRVIERYDGTNPQNLETAKRIINLWWNIHQEWNRLSNSYRPKIEECYRESGRAIMK